LLTVSTEHIKDEYSRAEVQVSIDTHDEGEINLQVFLVGKPLDNNDDIIIGRILLRASLTKTANTAGDGYCFLGKQSWKTRKASVCLENV
jgi:hypothetical protein